MHGLTLANTARGCTKKAKVPPVRSGKAIFAIPLNIKAINALR
jgi:hypothetical protein